MYSDVAKVQERGSRRSPTQARTMAADVVRLYISLISQFFTLSDMAVSSPSELSSASSGVSGADFPPFMPQSSNALTTAHYLTRILAEIRECRVGNGYSGSLERRVVGYEGLVGKRAMAIRERIDSGVAARYVTHNYYSAIRLGVQFVSL